MKSYHTKLYTLKLVSTLVSISMDNTAYLARQPIIDKAGDLFGYELLFRSGPVQSAQFSDAFVATAQLLDNAFNSIGVDKIVGPNKAFLNCSRKMLLNDLSGMLDPERFVIEILEDVEVDSLLVESVQKISSQGFEIALDDLVFSPEVLDKVSPLLPFAQFVKIDLMANSSVQRTQAAEYFKSKGIKLLAEKVESEADVAVCRQEGYEFFQGYFFAKPELLSSEKIDARTAGILSILQVLWRDPEVSEVEIAFKGHPEITINLLRYINSASVAVRHKVSSIRQAITLVGLQNLRKWLTLLLYARSGNDVTFQNPLFQNAIQRANFLESITKRADQFKHLQEESFLVGILSRMDALCRVSIRNILAQIDLGEEITAALLNGEGTLGRMLSLVSAIEEDHQEQVARLSSELKLREEMLSQSLLETYRKST